MKAAQDERIMSELADRADFAPPAKRIRIILSKVKENPSPSILDCGCGTGWVSYFLQKARLKTVMLDISQEKLSKCLLLKKDHLILSPMFRGSVTDIPFKDGTFDICLLLDVIEHVPLLSQCMNEISRVLTSRGKLLMTVPNKFGSYTLVYDFLGKGLFGERIDDHVHYLSIQSLRRIPYEYGFSIESVDNIEFLSPLFHMVSRNLKYGKRLVCYLSRLDVLLSDHLPEQVVSEWFITASKVRNAMTKI